MVCVRVPRSHRRMHRGMPAGGVHQHAPGDMLIHLPCPQLWTALQRFDPLPNLPHLQVPAWNDACLKRCTSECARGRTF